MTAPTVSEAASSPLYGGPGPTTLGIMLGTSIRTATAEDLELLQTIEDEADELFASVFSIVDWHPAPSGVERSRQPGFILVASDEPGSEPLGFAHVLSVPGGAHLEQLSVRPSMMRRGHGRALVAAVTTESGRRGCDRVTLRTYADIPWNAPFYGSCGFVPGDPDTDFLRGLLAVEQQLELGHGPRVQMNYDLRGNRTSEQGGQHTPVDSHR